MEITSEVEYAIMNNIQIGGGPICKCGDECKCDQNQDTKDPLNAEQIKEKIRRNKKRLLRKKIKETYNLTTEEYNMIKKKSNKVFRKIKHLAEDIYVLRKNYSKYSVPIIIDSIDAAKRKMKVSCQGDFYTTIYIQRYRFLAESMLYYMEKYKDINIVIEEKEDITV